MPTEEKPKRAIRSYVLRQGRMTLAQRRAIENYWSDFGLDVQNGVLDYSQVFANDAPLVLEIGFGMGQSLLQMAQQNPANNYIGVEVHRPGVGALLANIVAADVKNIRIFCVDVMDVLTQCINDASLARVQIYFPDPWPKKRHHKRRLIQTNFIALLHRKLKVAGELHLATDWEEYAKHMLTIVDDFPGFKNAAGLGKFSPDSAGRVPTKFESRGQKLGHGIWDILVIKE